MDSKDGRKVARENEVRILRALHRFGWLRTRDIAVLVWQIWATKPPHDTPNLQAPTPTASGLRMAQRTLRRLRDSRQILSADAPDGSVIYALAEAGARILRDLGIAASTGKDRLRSFSAAHFRHRCISNEVTISAIIQGFRASTEHEIAQGLWLGGSAGIAGKRPDVLIHHGKQAWWIEIEKSRKNVKDYSRLLVWLEAVRRDAFDPTGMSLFGNKMTLCKIVFICTPSFRSRLIRDLEAVNWKKSHLDSLIYFAESLYCFKSISFN